MSFNVLQDNNLDIEIYLAKKLRYQENGALKTKIETITQLEQSAILDLSIVDSLKNFGVKGYIKIFNKGKILDTLKAIAGNSEELYISVEITDPELRDASFPEPFTRLSFLGLVQNSASASANIEDNIIILEFEEAFIAEMRYTAWSTFVEQADLPEKFTAVDVIEKFANTSVLEVDETIVEAKATTTDTLPKDAIQPGEEPFVVDVFIDILNKTTTTSNKNTNHLPLFRLQNVGVDNNQTQKRRMVFNSYFTDRHRAFIKEAAVKGIQDTETGPLYSDVYTEKFTVGPMAQFQGVVDPNTNWHNSVESINVSRPDVDRLKKTKWVNYKYYPMLTREQKKDVAKHDAQHITYAQAVDNFITVELDLNDGGANLPLLDPKGQGKKNVFKSGKYDESDRATENEIYNELTKSFVFANEQVQFDVKGRIYRTPGNFIWIERPEDKAPLSKLWFVNSITHKLEDGKYTTSIWANRVFGDTAATSVQELRKEVDEYLNSNAARKKEEEERRREVEAEMDRLETLMRIDWLAPPVEQAGPPVAGAGSAATEAEIETIQRTQFSTNFLPPQ